MTVTILGHGGWCKNGFQPLIVSSLCLLNIAWLGGSDVSPEVDQNDSHHFGKGVKMGYILLQCQAFAYWTLLD